MKKWWSELQAIERYLRGTSGQEEQQAFRNRLQADTALQERVAQQQLAYQAIRWHGRRKLRREIQALHHRLLAEQPDSQLARKIQELFPGDDL
jgi:hypothetical protein